MEKTNKSEAAKDGAAKDGAPSADGLARAASQAAREGRRGPPPVHLWNPPDCGPIPMRIARDGTWFYQGTPIGRPAMVRLFSTILRRDPDGFVLVTPVEKVHIEVEDAPFVAVDADATPAGLLFTTNVGDAVLAGPENPVRVAAGEGGEPAPYVHVRRGLEARIDRKTFYRLVDMGEVARHEGADWFGVRSGGAFFPICPASEIADP